MFNLEEFQITIHARSVQRSAGKEWSLAEWTNALAGEVGEACNISKKILRHDLGQIGNKGISREELVEKLSDELADVIIYTSLIASELNLNLGECVARVFNRKSEELGLKERIEL